MYSPDDDLSSDEEDRDGEYGDEEEEEEVGVPGTFIEYLCQEVVPPVRAILGAETGSYSHIWLT